MGLKDLLKRDKVKKGQKAIEKDSVNGKVGEIVEEINGQIDEYKEEIKDLREYRSELNDVIAEMKSKKENIEVLKEKLGEIVPI